MSEARWQDCGNGVRLERGVRCRLSDGIELVSDHYHPPAPGSNPTLLMRQPYGRDLASTVVYAHPIWFARRGYNVVIQDVRGRGDSGGEFYPFRHEARDGAETIAWLRTRPETNGRIGMYGFSYQGMTQLLAAAEQPEVACIAPGMTARSLCRFVRHHGVLCFALPRVAVDAEPPAETTPTLAQPESFMGRLAQTKFFHSASHPPVFVSTSKNLAALIGCLP
jgi:putative CocE/NonD family hydrolase